MKAVLITDSFQVIIMIAGLLAILIKGSMEVGGFSEAWSRAYDSDRVRFDEYVFLYVSELIWESGFLKYKECKTDKTKVIPSCR